jgi:hypothetical protein
MSTSLLSLVKRMVRRSPRRAAAAAKPFRPAVEGLEERLALFNGGGIGTAFQTNSLPGLESGRAAAMIGVGVNPYVGLGGGILPVYPVGLTRGQFAQPIGSLAGIGAPGGISQATYNAYMFGGLGTTSTYGGYGYGYGTYNPYVAYSPYGGYSSYTPYGSYSPYGGYGGYSGYGLRPSQNPTGYGVLPGGVIVPGGVGPYA